MNYNTATDDELREYISRLDDAMVDPQPRGADELLQQVVTPAGATPDGRSGWELFGGGLKKSVADPLYEGPKDLAKTIWRGGKKDLDQLNSERAQREEGDERLMNNWQAKAGNFTGKVVASALAPARLIPQAILSAADAALSPSKGPIEDSTSSLATRGVQGVEGAATTLIPGAVLKGVGKVAGAATGRYTPEGQEAIRLNDAANRIGVKRNLGSLDQSSGLNAFESSMPGYSRTVEQQVKDFSEAAKREVQIPSATGKSTTPRVLPGENVRESLVEAGQNLLNQGKTKWNELDSYIVQNNLAPVDPLKSAVRVNDIAQKYTPVVRGKPQIDKNPIIQRVQEYDDQAAEMLKWMSQNNVNSYAIPFSELHTIQAAVGKALARAERDAAAAGASMADRAQRTELKNLYGSLMSDVDSWGTKNPLAKEMFDDARGFWRDQVVPGIINNKLYSKASKGTYGMNPRGYLEPKSLYADISGNPQALSYLTPYMSPKHRDLIDTLTTMPDVSRALSTNTPHPTPSGMGALTQMAGMAIGSPLQFGKAAVSHLPGFSSVMRSDPAKKMYFSRDLMKDTPLGRLGWAASQEPQEEMLQRVQKLRRGMK